MGILNKYKWCLSSLQVICRLQYLAFGSPKFNNSHTQQMPRVSRLLFSLFVNGNQNFLPTWNRIIHVLGWFDNFSAASCLMIVGHSTGTPGFGCLCWECSFGKHQSSCWIYYWLRKYIQSHHHCRQRHYHQEKHCKCIQFNEPTLRAKWKCTWCFHSKPMKRLWNFPESFIKSVYC